MSQEALKLSKQALACESSQRSGNESLSTFLKTHFSVFPWQSLKLDSQYLHYFDWKKNKNSEDIDLLFYINGDTNNPSHLSLWNESHFDPLNPTLKQGKLIGLGAAHEKASLVPSLMALKKSLKKENLNIFFAIGYGKEDGMLGAKRLHSELLKTRKVKKMCVAFPTESKPVFHSVGRTKMEVFFPFSEKEKQARENHNTQENTLSQSKIYNHRGGERLEDNVIFKALEACSLLPGGTLLLDMSAGRNTITEAESLYLEVDFSPNIKDSMVSRLEKISEVLLDLNQKLLQLFSTERPRRALHLGKCTVTSEGLSLYGLNLIPPKASVEELKDFYELFHSEVEKAGGLLRIRDSKKPFSNSNFSQEETVCLNVTEASYFSRYYNDIVILGLGKEGLAKQANEFLSLDELDFCVIQYTKLIDSLQEK